MGDRQFACAASAVLSPQLSALPADRINPSLRSRPARASPTTVTDAFTLPDADPPALSANAPTDSAATTCVAPAQLASAVSSASAAPSSFIWPATVVVTDSLPERLSSPSSDAAPSGSFVNSSSASLMSMTSVAGVVRCQR